MNKRLAAIGFGAALSAELLTGCGSDDAAEQHAAETTIEQPAATSEAPAAPAQTREEYLAGITYQVECVEGSADVYSIVPNNDHHFSGTESETVTFAIDTGSAIMGFEVSYNPESGNLVPVTTVFDVASGEVAYAPGPEYNQDSLTAEPLVGRPLPPVLGDGNMVYESFIAINQPTDGGPSFGVFCMKYPYDGQGTIIDEIPEDTEI